MKAIYSWIKENISLLVGIFAIVSGIYGQRYVSDRLSDKLEVVTQEIIDMRTELIFTNERRAIRQNISFVDGYIKDILGKEATLKGLAVSSCLQPTIEGELLLEELGVDDMITKIVVRKDDTSIEQVLTLILTTDHIQRGLLKYSEEHEGEENIYIPEDLPAVLGATAAFYNSIK